MIDQPDVTAGVLCVPLINYRLDLEGREGERLKREKKILFFIFERYYEWWQSLYYLKQQKFIFLFSSGDDFVGHLQLCNGAGSFKEF